MSRLTRDRTAEPVSRDQILRHARGQGNIHFPCSADHEQDCQPYPVDPHSAICDDHTHVCATPHEAGVPDVSVQCNGGHYTVCFSSRALSLRNLVLGYECGRDFPAGVGPGDAAN